VDTRGASSAKDFGAKMKLPDFLIDHPDGEIRIVGHRIGLAHVVREYNRGSTADLLHLRFPTLSLATIHKLLAFYLENRAEVDAYVAADDVELKRLEELYTRDRKAPTLEELRERMKSKLARNPGG
jgi:uncharacterized protein (DUF433 family)